MAVVVIDEAKGGVVVFRGEAEGVFGEEVTVGDAGGTGSTGDGAEGGVVVVGGDAVLKGVVEDLGDVLVTVVGVEEIEIPILGTHDERARGDGLGGVPDKLRPHGVPLRGIQPLDAEVAVVDEAFLLGHHVALAFPHPHAAAHAVKGHRDHGVAGLPTDGAVFGVVGNRPNAGLGLDERLVTVGIILWSEVINRGVLVESVGGVSLAFGGGAVSNIVGFGDAACGGVIGDGLFAVAIHRIANRPAEGVPMAGEGLGILQFYLLLSPLAHKYLSSMRRLAKDGRDRKTSVIS